MNRRPGRRIAALVAAVALLASTLLPAHGMVGAMGGAMGGPALGDVCRGLGNTPPDGLPGGHDAGCAACCLSTAALPPSPRPSATSSPPYEAPAEPRSLAAPVATAGGNARAPPIDR
ncbi:MAG: hypothetical protein U1F54_10240 [Burkholderiales bacterium]